MKQPRRAFETVNKSCFHKLLLDIVLLQNELNFLASCKFYYKEIMLRLSLPSSFISFASNLGNNKSFCLPSEQIKMFPKGKSLKTLKFNK